MSSESTERSSTNTDAKQSSSQVSASGSVRKRRQVLDGGGDVVILVINPQDPSKLALPSDVPRFPNRNSASKWLRTKEAATLLANRQCLMAKALDVFSVHVEQVPSTRIVSKPRFSRDSD